MAAHLERLRPPVHLRDKLDLSFRIEGQSAELFEVRPRWDRPEEQTEEPVAMARYVKTQDEWLIYWMRGNLKWYAYDPVPSVRDPGEFLAVVEADTRGCFFG